MTRIQYCFVYDQEPLGFWVPRFARSLLFDLAVRAPSALPELLSPVQWARYAIAQGAGFPKHLTFLQAVHVEEYASLVFRSEDDVPVFLFHSVRADLDSLANFRTRPFLVTSDSQEYSRLLITHPATKGRFFLPHLLEHELLKLEAQFGRASRVAQLRMIREHKRDFRKILPRLAPDRPAFLACRNNYDGIYSVLDPLRQMRPREYEPEHRKRPILLVESVERLMILRTNLADFEFEGKSFQGFMPPLTWVYPSHDPMLRKLFLRNLPPKEGRSRWESMREVVQTFLAEQDSATYDVHFRIESNVISEEMKLGASEMLQKVRYLDNVGALHSSFYRGPYFRSPLKGGSIGATLSPFSPPQFRRRINYAGVYPDVMRAGATLAASVPDALRKLIPVPLSKVVAISDLPLEWLCFDGEPLSFLSDLCRVPETIPTNLLSQYASNLLLRFVVTKEILSETLVICGSGDEDPIAQASRLAADACRKAGLGVPFVNCRNKGGFFSEIAQRKPKLLIVDCHGDFQKNELGSVLRIGHDELTGRDIAAAPPMPPLVILSCCWGAPVFGCANTIAHAFFEAGSLAVTTTFLPVDAFKAARLNIRILNNLGQATSNALHRDWSEFLAHNIRTSLFDDCWARLVESLGERIMDPVAYLDVRTEWQFRSMNPMERVGLFTNVADWVVKAMPDEFRERGRAILARRDFVPECMFYTTLGRADLVLFDSWSVKHTTWKQMAHESGMPLDQIEASLKMR